MRILVLNPPYLKKFSRPQRSPAVTKSGTLYFPLWLALCVGVLEQEDHQVDFIDAPAADVERADVLDLVREKRPGLVVMETSTPSVFNDADVAAAVKQAHPEAYVVFVGTHVSALPRETLEQFASVDAVCVREYDYTVRDLAAAVDAAGGRPDRAALEGVLGLAFRAEDGAVVVNEPRPFIDDLDALPWASKVYKRHLDIRHYFNPNALYPMVTLTTSRGCPFHCSFCVYPQTLTGHKYRFRSIEDVVDEMQWVVEHFPEARSVFFEDDTLTANKKRCLEFSQAIIDRGITFSWTANSRIDLDYETMKLMRKAGCRMLCVGFESGDPDMLKAMRKGTKRERMKEFMDDARRAGILIHGCFIFGFPGETRASIEKTIDFSIELAPDTVQFYPVMVYPGTQAYGEYQEKGWITAQDFSRWLTPDGLHNCVVRNEHLGPEELVRLCDEARRRFYLRPGYVARKMGQAFTNPAEFIRTAKAAKTFLRHLLRGSRV
jgi:radical SAM superfamily enzyme YgiQ (UPF0313 family)